MAWFKKARKPIVAPDKASRVPEGLWVKCPDCDAIIYQRDLVKTLSVCSKCGYHFRLTARERLLSLFDGEHWVEQDAALRSNDPLRFTDTKPYRTRLDVCVTRLSDGDQTAFTAVMAESYHTVWFEMHQDLLLTLGRERET